MTQAVAPSSTIVGVEAIPVEVQVDVSNGLPAFTIVGLGDAAVLEARERVRSALRASGFDFPNSRVTVNLAPAPVRKHGTGFDRAGREAEATQRCEGQHDSVLCLVDCHTAAYVVDAGRDVAVKNCRRLSCLLVRADLDRLAILLFCLVRIGGPDLIAFGGLV